jgi:riboflavin kinase/FMN adenylyltransferase
MGRTLGVPTANLAVGPFAALPADGVYAAWVTVEGERFPAGVSVGQPPTFPEAGAVVEAHLIGFTGDLYGRAVTVEFVERLREQRRFESSEDLAAAIHADIMRVASLTRPESRTH